MCGGVWSWGRWSADSLDDRGAADAKGLNPEMTQNRRGDDIMDSFFLIYPF